MATTFDWLNDTNLVISSTTETIYANPENTTTHIMSILLHNTHSSAVTVTLYWVPDSTGFAGTAASGNQFFYRSLKPYETFVINDIDKVLGDYNDTLQALAGTDAKVTIFVDGIQVT